MTFDRPPAVDDPLWPRASAWLAAGADEPAVTEPDSTFPDIEVIGVPTSVGSISPSQAWRTPPAVRDALARLSPWDPVTRADLAGLAVRDAGDWPVAELHLEDMVATVREHAAGLSAGPVRAFLGGDNAITRPLMAGLLGPDLSGAGLVTLDAHHDVRHLDDGPRNGTPVRGLLADGLPGTNVVQVGIGAFTNSATYAGWCADQGIKSITAAEVHDRGIGACVDDAFEHLGHCERLYVDLDIDVVDAAAAPACPGARPGGISPHDLITVARHCGAEPRVAACDLVEVDAAADIAGRTVMLTAMALLAFASGVHSRTIAK